jgi:hypothetical protein
MLDNPEKTARLLAALKAAVHTRLLTRTLMRLEVIGENFNDDEA